VLRRIVFVVKTGVVGWGVTCAVLMFVGLSYQRGAWISPRRLPVGSDRCAECGDVRPRHTRWCTAGEHFSL
jgi:hypothetical protein